MKNYFSFFGILFLIICLGSCYPFYNLNKVPTTRGLPPRYDGSMPSKPGSCYAKCLIPPKMQYDTLDLAIYTKDDHQSNPNVETRTLITTPASTMWERKLASANCHSSDPNDCLVWCLVEVPAIVETHHILTDTLGSNDYRMKEVLIGEILSPSKTDWREVLCENKTEAVRPQIISKLNDLNYLETEVYDSGKFKAALITYQAENQLPRGNLDFETLDALGVLY